MLSRSRTPFSSMTAHAIRHQQRLPQSVHLLCDTVWISVVARTMSSGRRRPLESIKWDAKMVLMRVDFPRPVWPVTCISRDGAISEQNH